MFVNAMDFVRPLQETSRKLPLKLSSLVKANNISKELRKELKVLV